MNKKQFIIGSLSLVLSSAAFAGNKHALKVNIQLAFNNNPVCNATDHSGKVLVEGKGGKVYNENDLSWSSHCEISLPEGVKHCVMQGQSMQQAQVIDSWGSKFTGKSVKASMTSDSDVNPTYGKYNISYYCH